MAKDYPYNNNAEPSTVWPKVKEYFFCDADENLHWSDVAIVAGIIVVVSWAFVLGLSVLSQIL